MSVDNKLLVLIINDMVIFPNTEVRIEYDKNAEELPDEDLTYDISYQVTYIPADDTVIPVRYAVFGLGPNVNQKLKVLAGNTLDSENPLYTQDSNVTAIVRTDTAPSASNMTEEHIVSLETSKTPIYAWYDNGTIYYYSESEFLKFSESTSYMFSGFTKLTSIDLSKIDSSDVTDISRTLNNDGSLDSLEQAMEFTAFTNLLDSLEEEAEENITDEDF